MTFGFSFSTTIGWSVFENEWRGTFEWNAMETIRLDGVIAAIQRLPKRFLLISTTLYVLVKVMPKIILIQQSTYLILWLLIFPNFTLIASIDQCKGRWWHSLHWVQNYNWKRSAKSFVSNFSGSWICSCSAYLQHRIPSSARKFCYCWSTASDSGNNAKHYWEIENVKTN